MKWLIPICLLLFACASDPVIDNAVYLPEPEVVDNHEELERRALDSLVSARMKAIGLVDIRTVNDQISVDLKYATDDNFTKHQLYDTLRKLFLQEDVAIRLSKAQKFLDSLHSGYRLLVYDGVRPVQVQKEMWDALDSIPPLNRGKFVSNPALGSVHNFGAAVDLTILDAEGQPLDMGAGYDDFRRIAFPSLEAYFLKTGELSKEQYENRKLLRKVMRSQKFSNIPSEWWHFNAWSRIKASHKYQLLDSESGDSRWFKIVAKDTVVIDSLTIPAID